MKLSSIFSLTKQIRPKKKKQDIDKTIVMPAKATVEETAFPVHVAERYLVKRSLGKGAFGIVYLAEDKKIGRLVAIKQLFKSYVKDPEIHKRFMQEARIGAQLDHPNIINVFALEEDKKSACIIMEYLSGGSLEAYMDKNVTVEPIMALQILRGIMAGLDAAHKVMAVHRDIKPPNILFDHLGEPKISDFGIAYLPVDAGGAPEIDDEKSSPIIGTPRYMSPEQISGRPLDARTDLYSAGAVFYEILTGNKIFELSDRMEFSDICTVILYHKPKKPGIDIPGPILEIMMKLLEKDYVNRYQTAEAVILDIDKITSNATRKSSGTGDIPRIGSSGPLLSSPVTMFEDVIRLLLLDGVLAPSERRELNRRAERLGISDAQSRMIEEKIRAEQSLPPLKSIEEYRSLAKTFFASNSELKLLPSQKQQLKEKRNELKITKEESKILERQAREKVKLNKRRNTTNDPLCFSI
jgi:serine/threonine protein kinase